MEENQLVQQQTTSDGGESQIISGGSNGGGSPASAEVSGGSADQPVAKSYSEEDVSRLVAGIMATNEETTRLAVEDALKKAKMSAEELAEHEQTQKGKALDEKEKDLARRELSIDTAKLLADQSLPVGILELVLADDKDGTEKRIAAFKAVFDKAVQDEVVKRIAGKTPPIGNAAASTVAQGGFLQAVLENQAQRR